jgi:hypothetical protein
MNKIFKVAALLVILTAASSFSQEKGIKFGIRAGFSLYDYSTGEKEVDKYVNMGYGFGGGLAVNIPIVSSLSFAPEVNFLYRKPVVLDLKDLAGYEGWITEFAISIPAMLQFTPVEGVPFYLAAGAQLDIPIASEMTAKAGGTEVTEDTEGRTSIDFGIPLGIGYLITPNFGIDLRAIIGITSPSDDGEDSWNQYGLGLTYFF